MSTLSCSPSNESFIPTLLLTSPFPRLPSPHSGVSVSQVLACVTPHGVNHSPHFLAGELEQVTTCTCLGLSFPICKRRAVRGSNGVQGQAQGKRTINIGGYKLAGADWGPCLPCGTEHPDNECSRLLPAPPFWLGGQSQRTEHERQSCTSMPTFPKTGWNHGQKHPLSTNVN